MHSIAWNYKVSQLAKHVNTTVRDAGADRAVMINYRHEDCSPWDGMKLLDRLVPVRLHTKCDLSHNQVTQDFLFHGGGIIEHTVSSQCEDSLQVCPHPAISWGEFAYAERCDDGLSIQPQDIEVYLAVKCKNEITSDCG